jgi:selenide,water dikinase
MATLNRAACEAMLAVGITDVVHACTDVTGLGLLGHAAEMARASGVALELYSAEIPLLPGVRELGADDRFIPGGGIRNEEHLADFVQIADTLPSHLRNVLFDPQTSGGLLIAVGADHVDHLLREIKVRGASGAIIGRVESGSPHLVVR